MDQKNEFNKWMKSVEKALSEETVVDEDILEQGSCGCGAWNCPDCFPDDQGDLAGLEGQQIPAIIVIQPQGSKGAQPRQGVHQQEPQGVGMAGTHPVDGDTFDHDEDDEIDITMMGDEAFDEDAEEDFAQEVPQSKLPRAQGGGVKLGDIVQKFVKADTAGQESPLSDGGELEEAEFDDEDEVSYDDAAPIAKQNYHDEMSQIDPDEAMELIQQITNMQNLGFSKSNMEYTEDDLANLPAVKLKQVHQQVMGGSSNPTTTTPQGGEMDEATEGPKKPRTKVRDPLDDLEDQPPGQDQPLTNYEPDDGEYDDVMDRPEATPTPHMPRASAADTRARTANMNPSELMRDMMSRINPQAGGDEPELAPEPQDQENAIVARTARDVPAVISSAMRVAGVEMPEWHTVNNLPGYQQQPIRGMGRQIFRMFTRTPLEQIQTIANVDGQGPNTDAEMRAVANWLMQNADDLGEVHLDHGQAIPGYRPDVKEYSINGVRFHVVRDLMGQYIYAYPDADATTNQNAARLGGQGGAGPAQGRLPGGNTPRLREESNPMIRLSITEAIKFDDIIRSGLKEITNESMQELDESSLSKLIGKQQGGQRLVQWLHRKHKLGNMADLQPQPFNERMMWKEFKRNPDNFIVVSATGGVAGIKPYEKMIRDRMAAAAKKNREYDPGGDSTLQYQIIAFTADGQQIDPALLQPAREPGEEREADPTVMKARMGKISGRDTQNSDNVFNLLADQIGALRTVYLAGNAVERDKMQGRADMKKGPADMDQNAAIQKIFDRVRPVLKKLGAEALSLLKSRIERFNRGENYEGAQKATQAAIKLKQFLATIDTSGDVRLDTGWGSNTRDLSSQIQSALSKAAGAPVGSDGYKSYLNAAASGNTIALKPVLDSLRDSLVGLQ